MAKLTHDDRESNELPRMPDFDRGTNGLLPAIAQDAANSQVLMLAWMSQESFDETIRTGKACYYSRSRKRLWRKGEESGHVQEVVSVHVDCDADTILLKVRQKGAACHEGYASCFFRELRDGEVVIASKPIADPDEIYGN